MTHFGSVRLSFIWKQERGGHLLWTKQNTEVVVVMVQMIMRILEMCT